MKIRNSFVTNSSSSSFLITNKTDKPIFLSQLAEEWRDAIFNHYNEELTGWSEDWGRTFKNKYPTPELYLEAAKASASLLLDRPLEPNEKIELECSDHDSDGLLGAFIHNSEWEDWGDTNSFKIDFLESHH